MYHCADSFIILAIHLNTIFLYINSYILSSFIGIVTFFTLLQPCKSQSRSAFDGNGFLNSIKVAYQRNTTKTPV